MSRWLFALPLLAACTPDDPGPPPGACDGLGTPSVTVGTGLDVFTPYEDGASLPFWHGPQGGWHVYGSVQVHGLFVPDTLDYADPDNLIVDFVVTDAAGASLAGYAGLPRLFTPDPEGVPQLLGERLILSIMAPEDVEGDTVTVEVTVTDACGTVVTDARSGVLHLSADP